MNENIDLTKILKNCPKGTKFYSSVHGDIEFISLLDLNKILFAYKDGRHYYDLIIRSNGKLFYNGECIIFPSKDQRDWSKFTAPWYKKKEEKKFDPKTLQSFDKVLVRDSLNDTWRCSLFSHIIKNDNFPYKCVGNAFVYCIPYNDKTKHLVGTTDEAPEYYSYWED